MMKRIAELAPTHTRRSDESQAMQQLSTHPDSTGALANGILRNASMRIAGGYAAGAAPIAVSPAAPKAIRPARPTPLDL